MRYAKTCIEQLDLAAVQLHQDNPAYRRFALILTDNIVELMCHMCHQKCEDQFWGVGVIPGFEVRLEEKEYVLGSDFAAKVNFLRRHDLITQDEQVFMSAAHNYRNESYHTGIVHDDIMHALAWHYHKIACELFGRLRPRVFGGSPDREWSAAIKKHCGEHPFQSMMDGDGFFTAAQSLAAARPTPQPNLSDVLATSALNRISSTEEQLGFIVEEDPHHRPEQELIRALQYNRDFCEGLPRKPFFIAPDAAEMQIIESRIQFMKTEWKPKLRRNPIQGWKRRAERIRPQKNCANALQNFDALKRDMQYFESLISDAASSLDAYIDMQITEAKERRAGVHPLG
jgi:hypothetical protein